MNETASAITSPVIIPPCPHFAACGGCVAQDKSEPDYRAAKLAAAMDYLNKAGLAPATIHEPIFIAAGTRRRATFAAIKRNGVVSFGFHRVKSHDVESINQCLLLTPLLQKTFDALKPFIAGLINENSPVDIFLQEIEGAVELVFTGMILRDSKDSDRLKKLAALAEDCNLTRIGLQAKEFDEIETLISLRTMQKHFSDLVVNIPIGNFLQPSDAGEAILTKLVTSYFPRIKKFKALDLFAGCGTFTGAVLAAGGQVAAYEIDKIAVESLQKSMGAHPKSRVEKRHLFDEPITPREMKDADVVILDPPRTGAYAQSDKLAQSAVKKIIYVSCSPQSFARDAVMLVKGGYTFTNLHIIDQFIWSSHVECVGVFEK